MTKLDSKARLRWACRRGMLELDVLFRPFVDEAYDDLSDEDKFIFQPRTTRVVCLLPTQKSTIKSIYTFT